jgi:beta-galactosidase
MDRRSFSKLAAFAGLGAVAPAAIPAEPQTGSAVPPGNQRRTLWDRYYLGSSYYPEWWEPSEWKIDFRQMHELGLNTVRMGEFAWARFEPSEGKFDFAWMDEAIDIANRNEIDAILSTPTASVPPWLFQAHPDVLTGDRNGLYTYGGRKGYNTNSPNFLEASARVVEALAKHYGRHPGVIGWQLDNEPGFPFEAYDPVSERAFQAWLKARYGTLEALNRAWNGAFWSNHFSDWSQVRFPTNSAEGGWQPAITLAYRQFFSDSFSHHLGRQAEILRESGRNQFIFTNWPANTWSVDVFGGAAYLDATAWDNYCVAPGISDFRRQYISGFNHDFSRSAGPHQRFLCAEQIAYVPANALDAGLRLQAYIDLAHGSHGHLYFEWRRPAVGGEQYRPSLIKRFDGTINTGKPVFEQIGREFRRLGSRLAGATTRADIALLYDFTNQWSQGFWSLGTAERRYDGEAMRYYNGFKVLQRNIDIVPRTVDFSAYRLVVAPNLHLVDDETVERLSRFVAGGGILVLNYRAGTQNMDNSMRRVLPPGAFAKIAGVTVESNLDLLEFGMLDRNGFGIEFPGNLGVFHPRTMLEPLTLRDAGAVAAFQGGRVAGRTAVSRNRHGQGWVFYVGTDCSDGGFYEAVAQQVGAAGKLSPLLPAPYGVEVVSREDSAATYYFLLNLTEDPHRGILLPQPMEDLLSEGGKVTTVSLDPLGVSVLAVRKQP